MIGVRGKIGSLRWCVHALLLTSACASARGGDPSQQLDGKDWRLVELSGRAAATSAAERRPYLRFVADSGRVSGSGGCNRLTGAVTLGGDQMKFGAIASTKMACVDAALNRQETEFFQALGEVDRFSIAGDTLSLLRGAVVVARLTP